MNIEKIIYNYIANAKNLYLVFDANFKFFFANNAAKSYLLIPEEEITSIEKYVQIPKNLPALFTNTLTWNGEIIYSLGKKKTISLHSYIQKVEQKDKDTFFIIEVIHKEFYNITLASNDHVKSINNINDTLNKILSSLNQNITDYTNSETSTIEEDKKLQLNKIESNLKGIRYFFRELTSDIIVNYGDERFGLFRTDIFLNNVLNDFSLEKQNLVTIEIANSNLEMVGIQFKLNYALKRLLHFIFSNLHQNGKVKITAAKDENRNQVYFEFCFDLEQNPENLDIVQSIKSSLPLLHEIISSHNGIISTRIEKEVCYVRLILPNQYSMLTELPIQVLLVNMPDDFTDEIEHCINVVSPSIIIKRISEADGTVEKRDEMHLADLVFFYFEHNDFSKAKLKLGHQIFQDKQIQINFDEKVYYDNENYFIEQNINLLQYPIKKKEFIREIKRMIYLQRKMSVLTKNIAITKKEAITDGLTGLYNRRYLNEYIPRLKNSLDASSENFTVIMCDIDNFKNYNDSNGHILGDETLKTFAQILTKNVRISDQIIRYGGEEFFVFLKETDKKTGKRIAEKIRMAVESHKFEREEKQPMKTVTASFGCANFPEDHIVIDDLIALADKRLYLAKQGGRNRVVYK